MPNVYLLMVDFLFVEFEDNIFSCSHVLILVDGLLSICFFALAYYYLTQKYMLIVDSYNSHHIQIAFLE